VFNNDQSVKNRRRTERMYNILGLYADEVTGHINDEGKQDVLFVYDLLGVYKIKFKLIFRWEIETNGNEKRKLILIHLFWRGRYK
jgi:hypothetical protein